MLSLLSAIERLSPFEQNRILENKNYYPQIAPIIESKIDKMVLTDEQIHDLNLINHNNLLKGSITINKVILEIRGGEFYDWVTLTFIICLFYFQETHVFGTIPLPHIDPLGWSIGKYDYLQNPQCRSNPPSRFERETLHMVKQMCKASADENGFVMSYDEAYNLVKETYSGSMQITKNFKITDWQAASHLYHVAW